MGISVRGISEAILAFSGMRYGTWIRYMSGYEITGDVIKLDQGLVGRVLIVLESECLPGALLV